MNGARAEISPRGDRIAFVQNLSLGIQSLWTDPPRTELRAIGPHLHESKVTAVRWSHNGRRVLVHSDQAVRVEDVTDQQSGTVADLDNGSGGIGRIVSAEFISDEEILVIWEFGKTKVWNLDSGGHVDLPDAKTSTSGLCRQLRPRNAESRANSLLALLSRPGADDHLVLHFSSSSQPQALIKLPTADAQSLSWSADGRWLAILDVPSTSPAVHIYTPDGHIFRSYTSAHDVDGSLSTKSLAWSPNGKLLAFARHDNLVELINTRTFTFLGAIKHSTTIDRTSASVASPLLWQETVAASKVRSYALAPQPVSLPLSKIKASTEPHENGIIEIAFNMTGKYLATRDARTLNTAWLWDLEQNTLHAALFQHSNIRRMMWHPTRADVLLVDCAEGIIYLYDVGSPDPPQIILTGAQPKAALAWVNTPPEAKCAILVREKSSFHLLYPEGHDPNSHVPVPLSDPDGSHSNKDDGGEEEDSLLELLSGRKPLPPKTMPSYTELVDMQVDDTFSGQLDDTFHEKRRLNQELEKDPLDDSQIF